MNQKAVDKAPVESVGGNQDSGPWPKELEEIAVDDRLKRPFEEDGEVVEREVVIEGIDQIVRPDGTETDGYVVRSRF